MVVISAGTEFRIVASVLKCLEMLSAQCVWLLLVQVQSSELLPVYYVVLCIVVSVIIMFLLAAGIAVSVAFKVVFRVDIFFQNCCRYRYSAPNSNQCSYGAWNLLLV